MQKRIVASILVAIAICGVGLGLFKLWLLSDRATDQEIASEFLSETIDRNILEGNTDTKIPQSATDIHGLVGGFREITTYVRFTIPATDLEQFLSSTACTGSLLAINAPDVVQITPEKDWWQIRQARVVNFCSGATENLGQMIYVDMTNSEIFVLYVIAQTR